MGWNAEAWDGWDWDKGVDFRDFRDFKHLCLTGTTITKDTRPRKLRRQWKLQKR